MKKVLVLRNQERVTIAIFEAEKSLETSQKIETWLGDWIQEDAQDELFHNIEFWTNGSINRFEDEYQISGDNGILIFDLVEKEIIGL